MADNPFRRGRRPALVPGSAILSAEAAANILRKFSGRSLGTCSNGNPGKYPSLVEVDPLNPCHLAVSQDTCEGSTAITPKSHQKSCDDVYHQGNHLEESRVHVTTNALSSQVQPRTFRTSECQSVQGPFPAQIEHKKIQGLL